MSQQPACSVILERIRRRGPIPFAEFMSIALYHPEAGYYASSAMRSGRAGDFVTSVDLGPVFGELVATELTAMWTALDRPATFDLVEAGAGNGRLTRDVLDTIGRETPDFYRSIRAHLVEASAVAREAARDTLREHAARVASIDEALPRQFEGALFANELLDALPTHAVVAATEGLQEVYVDAEGDRLVERVGPLSTPRIGEYVERLGVRLEPGWRAEVNLAALDWVRECAGALARGFLLLIDYGHEAHELYSAAHPGGTLTSFRRHVADAPGSTRMAAWLQRPGACDITAHVDLTSVRWAAGGAGLTPLGTVDQTYFLLGLGLESRLGRAAAGDSVSALHRRLALKTLLMPGGLGSTHKVMAFGKGVGTPALPGLSGRATR